MTRTALQMTPEEWKAYLPGLVRARRQPAVARRRRALEMGQRAADLLRRDFGATKVLVFGSVVRPERFTRWSDIDLAAWGIPPERFYAAVAAVTALSDEFEIDLLDVDSARPVVLREAEVEGAEL